MLSGNLSKLVAARRFNMLLLTLFAVLAVVIACVGIYRVMAYVVTLRTQEIGIRLALGAAPLAILRAILGRALIYVLGGLAIGLLAAMALSALVSGFLLETRPHHRWVRARGAAGRYAGGHGHHRRVLSRAPGGQGRSACRVARGVALPYDATQTASFPRAPIADRTPCGTPE